MSKEALGNNLEKSEQGLTSMEYGDLKSGNLASQKWLSRI